MSPCDGPDVREAYEDGDEAFEKLIDMLVKDYRVSRSAEGCAFPLLVKDWDEKHKALRQALREFIWADRCVGW